MKPKKILKICAFVLTAFYLVYSQPFEMMRLAIEKCDDGILSKLISQKEDLNNPYKNGQTALFISAWKNCSLSVELLIASGVEVDNPCQSNDCKGWTPLMIASSEGHTGIVKRLLKGGANPNAENSFKRTALMYSSNYGFMDIVDTLLSAGADPNVIPIDGPCALIAACNAEHNNIVKTLVNYHANVNATDEYKDTPLHIAGRKNSVLMANILLDAKANPNKPNIKGEFPIHFAVLGRNLELVKLLLDNGANPNVKTADAGNTPLIYASGFGEIEIMKALVEKGANVNLANSAGTTPMKTAKLGKKPEAQELLKKLGAKK